ncbi:uncharacterized protein SAPINGB_P000747 [Magnusiomyces paraingens]|uniref:Nudix hydrolase domain-containing protein n=1 Tax=Magnusiomyces paraingens TaxID=2606893 RepID=A0A5E8B2J6_9ASCO|nr:uncharacterized protein SAPINGB_P000747 [Saprochaete ingens]VVT45429.1 unnamed protein product [Saprochaete ingens]
MFDLSQQITAAYYPGKSPVPGNRSQTTGPEKGTEAKSHALWMSYPARKRCAVLAILFPLDETGSDYGVVLTQRSPALRTSPSVSAFPGGRLDAADNNDEWACALREAHEEIGFDPANVPGFERLAISPCYLSLGNDAVRMCICKATPKVDLIVANNEPDAISTAHKVGPETGKGEEISVEKVSPKEPAFLKHLAPKPSPTEVAVAYAVPLSCILTNKWYVRGTPMLVAGHPWIFHKYRVPVGDVLGLVRSHAVTPAEINSAYQDSDEEIEEEMRQQASAPEPTEEVPQWTTRTPTSLKYTPGEKAIPLHGLTSHMVVDLARALHPGQKVLFEVLPQLGSDEIVSQYHAETYGPNNSGSSL